MLSTPLLKEKDHHLEGLSEKGGLRRKKYWQDETGRQTLMDHYFNRNVFQMPPCTLNRSSGSCGL